VNYALQEVLNVGSGSLIQPRLSPRTNFPVAAKTGTSNLNESTWVVGHTTGLATAAWFGDALGAQNRPGRNLTFNGKFYESLDGYMIAGPMFSKYMAQMAPAYGTNPFPAPPPEMVNGTQSRTPAAPTVPTSPATAPAPAPAPSTPAADTPGNGNKKDG
jgi:membrane peptidoglycan carboxypeptidase